MTTPRGVEVLAPVPASYGHILSYDALQFLALLARMFENRRQGLLLQREERQEALNAGIFPDKSSTTPPPGKLPNPKNAGSRNQ